MVSERSSVAAAQPSTATSRMPGRPEGTDRTGSLSKVVCRCCRVEMNRQSYSEHLKVKHNEDPSDLRPYGQNTLFTIKKRKLEKAEVKKDEPKSDAQNNDEKYEEMDEKKPEVEIFNEKLKSFIAELGLEMDFSHCNTEEEKLNQQLDFIKKRLEVKDDVKRLTEKLCDLEMMSKAEVKREPVDEDSAIKVARSVKEITEKVPEFEQKIEKEMVNCQVCEETFKYTNQTNDFTDEKLPKEFTNLKRSLRQHLMTSRHKNKVAETRTAAVQWEKEELRNKKVGMNIVRQIYNLLHSASPDAELPVQIYLLKRAGVDVGDINHSHNLVAKMAPHLAGAVEGRLKKFLGTRMAATDALPPVNLMFDKATDKRDSRQLVGGLTINPGGTTLYKAFFFDCPKCPRGSGEDLTGSIVSVADKFITAEQYSGGSGALLRSRCTHYANIR